MTNDDVLAVFRETGALLNGHFVLTSGRHADTYFEKFDVLRYPAHVESLCGQIASHVRSASISVDVVLGPTTLGIVMAYEVAKQLGATAAYGEKGPDNSLFLRRPDHMVAGDRVLIVDDVITAGTSAGESVSIIAAAGAQAVGVVIALDRQERGKGASSALQELSTLYGITAISIIDLGNLIEYLASQSGRSAELNLIAAYQKEYGI